MKLLLVICIVATVFIIYQIYEKKHFKIKEYIIESDKLNNLKKELKIVFLTDLHNNEYGKNNAKLIETIKEINPDIILTAGDLLIAKPNKKYDKALKLMESLARDYPCFYANGNHEYRMKIYKQDYGNMYEKYKNALKKANVRLLENEHDIIEINGQKLCIYGLEIDREYYKRFSNIIMERDYIEKCLDKPYEDCYNILLAHNPRYYESYAKWGANLTLSGHLHGGLVRIPFIGGIASPQMEIFPKYSSGKYTIGDKIMILSAGLGTHTINVRVNNPAELSVIKLTSPYPVDNSSDLL